MRDIRARNRYQQRISKFIIASLIYFSSDLTHGLRWQPPRNNHTTATEVRIPRYDTLAQISVAPIYKSPAAYFYQTATFLSQIFAMTYRRSGVPSRRAIYGLTESPFSRGKRPLRSFLPAVRVRPVRNSFQKTQKLPDFPKFEPFLGRSRSRNTWWAHRLGAKIGEQRNTMHIVQVKRTYYIFCDTDNVILNTPSSDFGVWSRRQRNENLRRLIYGSTKNRDFF